MLVPPQSSADLPLHNNVSTVRQDAAGASQIFSSSSTEESSEGPAPLLTSVLDQIGSDIVIGAIKEGQTFTLQDISARFGISRTVAREAMRALEQRGMVHSSRRVGLRVLPIEEWQVLDPLVISWRLGNERSRAAQLHSLNQLRLAIEPIAARLAAEHATPQQAEELLSLAHRLHELEVSPSRRVGEELSTDLRFHTGVLKASGNELFMALAPNLLSMLKGRSIFGSRKRDPIAGTDDLHIELAQAIADGDGDRAERISRSILDEARAQLD